MKIYAKFFLGIIGLTTALFAEELSSRSIQEITFYPEPEVVESYMIDLYQLKDLAVDEDLPADVIVRVPAQKSITLEFFLQGDLLEASMVFRLVPKKHIYIKYDMNKKQPVFSLDCKHFRTWNKFFHVEFSYVETEIDAENNIRASLYCTCDE